MKNTGSAKELAVCADFDHELVVIHVIVLLKRICFCVVFSFFPFFLLFIC